MSAPQIRRATPADAEQMADICRRTFVETFGHLYPPEDLAAFLGQTYGPERLRGEIADPQTAVWFLEIDGDIAGYAQAGRCALPHPEVTAASGELKRLYLTTAAQNGGLGGRLFDTAEQWLLRDGPRDLWIGVWSENLGAQRFYARRSFKKVGEYDFAVGAQRDHEFILRRRADSFSA